MDQKQADSMSDLEEESTRASVNVQVLAEWFGQLILTIEQLLSTQKTLNQDSKQMAS